MEGQTLIFGVGAAKAGTSWLFDYLAGHDEVYLPTVKELHYFNALEFGRGKFFRELHQRHLADFRWKLENGKDEARRPYRARAVEDVERWLSVFDGQTPNDAGYLEYLGRGRAGAKVIGDITPAYALLSVETFRRMAGLMGRVRFVYLLREPVDRLWSHIRMDAGTKGEAEALRRIDDFLDGGQKDVSLRSNYRRTINRIWQAAPKEALHVEFYERLFSPEAITRLCAFLGLTPKPAAYDKAVHKSRVGGDLDADRRARAEAALRPQYNFVRDKLGGLPSEWTARMVTA